jgi:hypothetical protein
MLGFEQVRPREADPEGHYQCMSSEVVILAAAPAI